ncbi:MAG: cation transporter [Proteobacteria bacterium]|nr:MAG: cation transporter [Pseudomonadota bacterium]
MAAARASLDHGTRLRAGGLALVGAVAILATKLLAWALTGSTAVLSDALESFVNVAAGAILLYSLYLSSQPADRNHPYGHGKVEFFSAGVEGTLIALAAVLIAIEAVRALIAGPSLRSLDLGLALVSAAAAGNALLGWYLIRVGRSAHSLALVADGKHLLTDVVTSAGVIAGLALVRVTGNPVFDPLVALAVAAQILWTGWRLTRQAVGGLMDEADLATLRAMVGALASRRQPWWIDAHSLRAWRSGPVEHVDLHLVVPRYFDADQLHEIDREVEDALLGAVGRPGEAIVHFDPCRPRYCSGCAMPACPVRQAALEAQRPVTFERATRGDESLDTGAPVPRVRAAE